MRQLELYDMARRLGFVVLEFSDHPDFFSSWSFRLEKNGKKYMLEHDGRDSWLVFYEEVGSNKYKEVDRKESHAMSEAEKLNMCETWLLSF